MDSTGTPWELGPNDPPIFGIGPTGTEDEIAGFIGKGYSSTPPASGLIDDITVGCRTWHARIVGATTDITGVIGNCW